MIKYPFKVKHDMDCNSKFVLYVLTCAGCGENYIGEIKAKLHTLRSACETKIKFTVFPFYKMTAEDNDTHRAKEEYFIKKFKPALNSS